MSYQEISVAEFKETLQGKPEVVVLDVRTEAELAEGSIPGYNMLNIMAPDFREKITALDKSQTYLVYCRSGNRSGQACQIMSQMGFENLYNLTGGIMAWNIEN